MTPIRQWKQLDRVTAECTLTLQLHNFDLFMTCRTSSFSTVAWQLARFQLARRFARSLGFLLSIYYNFRHTFVRCHCLIGRSVLKGFQEILDPGSPVRRRVSLCYTGSGCGITLSSCPSVWACVHPGRCIPDRLAIDYTNYILNFTSTSLRTSYSWKSSKRYTAGQKCSPDLQWATTDSSSVGRCCKVDLNRVLADVFRTTRFDKSCDNPWA